MFSPLREKCITKETAAGLIRSGMTIGCSGFVAVGHPKVILRLAAEKGTVKDLRLLSGGGTGDECVGELARSRAISFLCPYNNNPDARRQINAGEISYVDMHLSDMPRAVRRGLLGHVDLAIIECCMVDENGGIVPTLSVGAAEAFAACADRVLLELNLAYPMSLRGLHQMTDGTHGISCDPGKIVGIVVTNELGQLADEPVPTAVDDAIADNVVRIIRNECDAGRLSGKFAIEPGIGATAVAVFTEMSKQLANRQIDYVGVVQDGAIDLLLSGNLERVVGAALRLSPTGFEKLVSNLDRVRDRITILPQDVSNRAGNLEKANLVAVNTAIEADILGNVNSTHLLGNRIMNGMGGAADFTRHASLSVFMTPSVAKGGKISCIVPYVSHVDHSAYDVDFLVTEQGWADLRCKTPRERARAVVENCCNPLYREKLTAYLEACPDGVYTPLDLERCFEIYGN